MKTILKSSKWFIPLTLSFGIKNENSNLLYYDPMINLTSIYKIAKWLIILLLLSGIYAFSCESQSPLEKESEDQSKVSALIVYDGDPAVDGCGWLILHGQNFYSPVNLDSNFRTDNLKILLNYKILESTWNCGWRDPGYREIEIVEIKKDSEI